MRIRQAALLAAASAAAASCSTLRIPGEERAILRNVAGEYYTLGDGYMEVKNYRKAAECYRLAMRSDDVRDAAFYKLARSYALAQEWDSALSCYGELLARDPSNASLRASEAYVRAMSGDVGGAIPLYEKLAGENPHEEYVQENFTALLLFAGRGEEARAQYLRLKESFPDNARLAEFSKRLAELVPGFSEPGAEGDGNPSDGKSAEGNPPDDKKPPAGKKPPADKKPAVGNPPAGKKTAK